MKRRHLLAGLGGLAGTLGLAGCLAAPGSPTPTATPDPTTSWDTAPTPEETAFDVLERTCGSAENAATVAFGDDSVRVEGVIGGRDTCDTARLAFARVHHDVLKVVVEVVEEPTTATPACGQCLTDIAYVLTASGLRGGPARVRVVHRTADGEQIVAVEDRPA